MMKGTRVISSILSLALVCSMCSFANVKAATVNKIDIKNIRQYKVEDKVALSDGYELGVINIDNNRVYTLESKSDGTEYAYNVDGTVYYERYKDNKLVESKIYTDDYFQTEIQELSSTDEAIIDAVLKDNDYSSAEELEEALRRNGLNSVGVVYEEGVFFIDPFANPKLSARATPTKNIGIDGLKTKFPAWNLHVSDYKDFYAKPAPTVKTRIYCKDSRMNYVSTSSRTELFAAGTSVAVAAAKVCLSTSVLSSILAAYILTGKIISAVNLARSDGAKCFSTREAWIYDRTNYKTDVRIYAVSDTDYFTVTKTSDDAAYGWGTQGDVLFDRKPSDAFLDEAISIWQYNMDQYGKWR